MSKEQLYEERLQRVLTATDHIEPDKVPTHANILNWELGYYGTTYQECIENYEWYVKEVSSKIYRDVDFDFSFAIGGLQDLRPGQVLGHQFMFLSSNGVTLQHREGRTMPAQDYEKFLADPLGYFVNEFIPTTYKDVTIERIVEYVKCQRSVFAEREWVPEYVKHELGVPTLVGPARTMITPPMDFFFDKLRGFTGTLSDLRRHPELVEKAMEALYPFFAAQMRMVPGAKKPPYPFGATMFHVPTYLSYKQFMRFFAPTYERMINQCFEAGQKVWFYLEGDWSHLYDWLNSLPKHMALGHVENNDIIEMKKKVGDNITLVGGMPVGVLKYQSKEYCLDYAKRVIDACAPGGGFIFSTDKALIAPGDVNTENYLAVQNLVAEYGRK